MQALFAVGATRRARHFISVHCNSCRSSVFGERPIFVHADPCEPYSVTDEYPADFRNGRAFRAYDANYNMIDAVVSNGDEPEAVIENLLQNPASAFVDVRSVTRGCFTFRIERA
jgi:hypothetical protein